MFQHGCSSHVSITVRPRGYPPECSCERGAHGQNLWLLTTSSARAWVRNHLPFGGIDAIVSAKTSIGLVQPVHKSKQPVTGFPIDWSWLFIRIPFFSNTEVRSCSTRKPLKHVSHKVIRMWVGLLSAILSGYQSPSSLSDSPCMNKVHFEIQAKFLSDHHDQVQHAESLQIEVIRPQRVEAWMVFDVAIGGLLWPWWFLTTAKVMGVPSLPFKTLQKFKIILKILT